MLYRAVAPLALPATPYAAHSVACVGNWRGPAIECRNSATGVIRDIGMRSNVLDIDQLRMLIGNPGPGNPPTGTVVGMFDQSGNGRVAGQGTVGLQPSISPLNAINGIVPVSIDGVPNGTPSAKNMQMAMSISSQSISVFQCVRPNNSFNYSVFWEATDATPTERLNIFTHGSVSALTAIGLNSFDGSTLVTSSGLSPPGSPCMIGLTSNASNCTHYLNGSSHANAALGNFTLTALNYGFNTFEAAGYGFHDLLCSVVYNRVLTASEIAQIYSEFQRVFGVNAYTNVATQIVLDGDSSLTGYGSTAVDTLVRYLQQFLNRPIQIVNMGIFGTLATSCQTNFTANITPQKSSTAAVTIYLPSMGGNDMAAGATGAAAYATVKACCAAAKSAGFTYTAMCTFPDQVPSSGTLQTAFATFNTLARAGVGTDFDILCDGALDTRINSTAAATNTAIWLADRTHMTSLGQYYAMQDIATSIGAFVR